MYIKCYYNCVFMQSNMWFHKMRSDDIISVLKPDYRLLINGKQTFVPYIYKMFCKCEAPIKHAISLVVVTVAVALQ